MYKRQQYTCALDRQNAKLEPFFNPHHPAVLRAIKMTIEAGHRHGIWVGTVSYTHLDVYKRQAKNCQT